MIWSLTALLALAAAQPSEPNCAAPETQSQLEMNMCARLDFEAADRELNRVYREAIAAAQQADRELDRQYDQRPGYEAVLREAQRAWVAFREAHCRYEGYEEARGGSMEPMIYSGCSARLTRARIAQLVPQPQEGAR